VTFSANHRSYKRPVRPTAVICVDGCEPDYLAQAVSAGSMPWMAQTLQCGTALLADAVVPTFTNPNNLSIVTGAPPAVHGISGNYFLDPQSGQATMMNDPRWLCCPTLLAQAADAGLQVAVVTAKDKLCRLLGHGLKGLCFSAETASSASLQDHGIDKLTELVGMEQPDVYSPELSRFVMAAGLRLAQTRPLDLMYLSTTDYVQHKHAPGTPEANAFYAMLDGYFSALDAMGWVLAITADHGMSAKARMDGQAEVIYLHDWISQTLGQANARVILPITDPYVRHHAALGSYACVYLPTGLSAEILCESLGALRGIELALPRAQAAQRWELPPDRIGDVVVLADRHTVLGTTAGEHALQDLRSPLRSHGGLGEQRVPLILNRKLSDAAACQQRWRNFDAFHLALNLAAH
jgi:phosphonoacetate hydrolase